MPLSSLVSLKMSKSYEPRRRAALEIEPDSSPVFCQVYFSYILCCDCRITSIPIKLYSAYSANIRDDKRYERYQMLKNIHFHIHVIFISSFIFMRDRHWIFGAFYCRSSETLFTKTSSKNSKQQIWATFMVIMIRWMGSRKITDNELVFGKKWIPATFSKQVLIEREYKLHIFRNCKKKLEPWPWKPEKMTNKRLETLKLEIWKVEQLKTCSFNSFTSCFTVSISIFTLLAMTLER